MQICQDEYSKLPQVAGAVDPSELFAVRKFGDCPMPEPKTEGRACLKRASSGLGCFAAGDYAKTDPIDVAVACWSLLRGPRPCSSSEGEAKPLGQNPTPKPKHFLNQKEAAERNMN